MAPDIASQMGSPNFGPGVGQAQAQMGKSPIEMAVATVEKLLNGITDEAFTPYKQKAIATLKVGMAMAQQKQPQSGMTPPQAQPPGQAPIPMPPVPGTMPV